MPVKRKTREIGEYLKLCQNVGTEGHRAMTMAAAITAVKDSPGTCLSCGMEGHHKKNAQIKKGC